MSYIDAVKRFGKTDSLAEETREFPNSISTVGALNFNNDSRIDAIQNSNRLAHRSELF
jgi:hypothetical protein